MSQDSLFGPEPDAPVGAQAGAYTGPPVPPPDEGPTAVTLAAGATTLAELRAAAATCRACDLWRDATQTVFGDGPDPSLGVDRAGVTRPGDDSVASLPVADVPAVGIPDAELVDLVFVGEQPGDREDVEGRPFVGPAGALFDRALVDAGIDRRRTYVTNTVKHFKWTPQDVRGPGFRGTGKRRIHQSPNTTEIAACRPWLDAELTLLQPSLIVLLGATAGKTILGPSFRVTKQRGQVIPGPGGRRYFPTIHPSAILRTDEDRRAAAYADLVDDLRAAAAAVHG